MKIIIEAEKKDPNSPGAWKLKIQVDDEDPVEKETGSSILHEEVRIELLAILTKPRP